MYRMACNKRKHSRNRTRSYRNKNIFVLVQITQMNILPKTNNCACNLRNFKRMSLLFRKFLFFKFTNAIEIFIINQSLNCAHTFFLKLFLQKDRIMIIASIRATISPTRSCYSRCSRKWIAINLRSIGHSNCTE